MSEAIMPVLLDSDSADGTSFLADLSPGKYAYFGLNVAATVAAAEALVLTEMGRLRISEQGRDLVNIDVDTMASINQRERGNGFFTSTAGAAGGAIILIPRKYGKDNNAHLVTEQDLLQLSMQHQAAYDTAIDGGTIEVYGLLSETGEHFYNLKILQHSEAVAASAVETMRITEENVLGIYFSRTNPATDALRIRVMRDGQEVANGALQALSGFSDLLGQTDSLSSAAAAGDGTSATHHSQTAIMFANEGEIGEFLSDDIKVEITEDSTGATEEITVLAADFSPAKLRQSKVETASIVERKIARKNKLNRSRPIQSLRIAAE